MAGALSDQAQQLFCLIAAADHLTESTARGYFRDEKPKGSDFLSLCEILNFFVGNAFTQAAYPFSDRTSLRALALSTRVHHLFQPDGITLQSGPTQEKRKKFQIYGRQTSDPELAGRSLHLTSLHFFVCPVSVILKGNNDGVKFPST